MNTRGSVVVLPLVPSPKKIKFQSELHAILSYYIQRELRHVSTPYHLTQSVQMLGAPAPYQPKQKEKIWSRFCAIRFFLSWLSCYAFSCCTFLRSKSGGYILVHFLYWLRTALKSALLYLHTSTGSVQAST